MDHNLESGCSKASAFSAKDAAPKKSRLLIAVILVALCLRLAFFAVSVTHLPTTSDEASNLMLAEDIADGARPLLFIGQPYQFPVESYLYASFVRALPHNALGVRLLPFLLNLLAVGLLVLFTRQVLPLDKQWLVVLLVLFPSPYLLCLQSAYFIPQYAASCLNVAILLTCLAGIARRPDGITLYLVTGLIGGLAFSSHMLILSVLAAVMLICCLGRCFAETVRRSFCLAIGLILGLAPYLAAEYTIPGANDAVCQMRLVTTVLSRSSIPILSVMFPGALGPNPPIFPDFEPHLDQGLWLNYIFIGLFVFILLTASLLRSFAFIRRYLRDRWPSLETLDAPVIITWACLLLCLLNSRSNAISHRYAVPVALVFPFLLGLLTQSSRGTLRRLAQAAAMLWILFNIGTSMALIRVWTHEEDIQQAAKTLPLHDVLQFLETKQIHHVYAPFWWAYRIPFATKRRILGSQLYNERFPSWPTPYKALVDQGTRYALLVPAQNEYEQQHKFWLLRDFSRAGFKAERQELGGSGNISVWYNIRHPLMDRSRRIRGDRLHGTASSNPTQIGNLFDGNPATMWLSSSPQHAGMWLQINLAEQATLSRLTLRYTATSPLPQLTVQSWHDGQWIPAGKHISGSFDRPGVANGRPVFGEPIQSVNLAETATDALRIMIATPGADAPWALAEIELYMRENSSSKPTR